MIPRTFPSTYASNGQQQMVVYFLPSIAGLQRWLDYIPVKLSQGGVENSYANNGYIDVTVVSRPTATQQAWKEYIPVYLDDAATDAWRVNATGYIPYGYALFGGASMIMDMTNTGALDSRVTFSRTSNATQFDSAGNLVYAPHNLLTQSESFDNSSWNKFQATISANVTTAPDGTTTADKLIEGGGAAAEHGVNRGTAISITAGASVTLSVYAKADTRSRASIVLVNGAYSIGARYVFNLATGAVSAVILTGVPVSYSASAQSVGGGWYRCTITVVLDTSSTTANFNISTDNGTSFFYAGDGVSGLFIWGAQLNIGSLQPYYPTTVKNLLGFSQEFDNAAWTKANSFVQTNQIRNNTMQGAVAGSPGTSPTNWIISSSASGITREITGVGIESGISYVDVRFSGTPTAGTNVVVSFESTNQIAATAGQTWTESAFVKLQAGSFVGTSTTVSLLATDGTNGTEGFNSALITSTPSNLRDCRLLATGTLASGLGTTHVQPRVRIGCTVGVAFDLTLRIGWPQLVQGAVAGDPVPTYGTARAVMYPAPDGSVTGDKLVEDTTNSTHYVRRTVSGTVNTTTHTYSVYAKAGERSNIGLAIQEATTFTRQSNCIFNLSTGTASAVSNLGGSSGTASIVSVGGGWYRCSLTVTLGGADSNLFGWIYVANNAPALTYTGDGTSGIFIWGAQLSDSASLDPYAYNPVAAPTAAAYYGPRFDYDPATLAARGLLVEEQRTNSIRNNSMVGAVAGTPGTAPTNWVVSTGAGITRQLVEVGVENGIAYIDYRFSGTGSVVNDTQFDVGNFIAAASGQVWTHSAYCRLVAGSLTNVTVTQILAENSAAGAFLAASTQNITPTSAALGTQRYALTRTLNNASTAFTVPTLRVTSAGAIDVTVRIGLPQLELGAFATSVIPTTTAAATRTADNASMIGANFSNWYRQDEGTFMAEAINSGAAVVQPLFSANDSTLNNRILAFTTNARVLAGRFTAGGVSVNPADAAGTYTANSPFKTASAYSSGGMAISLMGGAVSSGAAANVPPVNRLEIGSNVLSSQTCNGHIRRIAYYPTRLSNAQLQAVTA